MAKKRCLPPFFHVYILLSVFSLFFPTIAFSQNQSNNLPISPAQLEDTFNAKANLFIDPISPDKYTKLTESQKNDLGLLSPIARELASRQDSREIMLGLLTKYNLHEGVAREILWGTATASRPYTKSDFPYLKKLFLLSFDFKRADSNAPIRGSELSITQEKIRYTLAFYISYINDSSVPYRMITNEELFKTDPRAWLEKQIPNNGATSAAK